MRRCPSKRFLLIAVLALSCQKKATVCSQGHSITSVGTPFPSVFAVFKTEGDQKQSYCSAVAVGSKGLLTSSSCITSLCGETPTSACAKNLSLHHKASGEWASVENVALYPGFKNINRITVEGFDLALLTSTHELEAPAISRMSEAEAKLVLEDNVGRTSDLDNRNNLLMSKANATGSFDWLPVNYRFPMGIKNQEALIGYVRAHGCFIDRGGALLGRKSDRDPYQLIGILSRGFPGDSWPTDCADSDGNIFSLLYDSNVSLWLESNGVGLVEPNPLPPTPSPTPKPDDGSHTPSTDATCV